jgi:outer membrane lipoprotein-sorting protein
MSIFTSRPGLRWAVPAVAAVAVVGAGVAAKTLAVAAEPELPQRSAAQLLVDLQTAQLNGLSGTVVERADLGLDALATLAGGAGSSNLTSLVSGKHTLRVWYSGPDKTRLALVGTNGETDVIRNGTDLWTWDSKSNTASHHVLSADDAKQIPSSPNDLTSKMPTSPKEAADLALKAIDESTQVSTGNSAKIAGRDAYELILAPKDSNALVSQVRLAIDAKEHVPLRVQVLAKGLDHPAFEVGFTQVSFARPDDAQFKFSPPAGAKVNNDTEAKPDGLTHGKDGKIGADGKPELPAGAKDTKTATIGKGWGAVFVARSADGTKPADEASKDPNAKSLLDSLTSVSGGKVFKSTLFTAMITDDGRILVGSVSQERLAEVAKDPAAQLK